MVLGGRNGWDAEQDWRNPSKTLEGYFSDRKQVRWRGLADARHFYVWSREFKGFPIWRLVFTVMQGLRSYLEREGKEQEGEEFKGPMEQPWGTREHLARAWGGKTEQHRAPGWVCTAEPGKALCSVPCQSHSTGQSHTTSQLGLW